MSAISGENEEMCYPIPFGVTQALSEYAIALKYGNLDSETLKRVAMFLVDYVSAVHAGYRVNGDFNESLASILFMESAPGCFSSVFFSGKKLSPMRASFLNASYAHGADMDDGSRSAMGHVGAHVISACVALCEARNLSNAALVEALVVGYDVYCRLSAAAQPQMVHRGFHSTGMAGAPACAAACAKLLGLDRSGIYHAIAISATQASGLLLVGETGQEIKPINPAKAAEAGLLSALLAEKGVVGPKDPLESSKGWFHAVSSEVDLERVLDGLGEKFAINSCYMKPYPSCRHTHSGLDAARKIRGVVGGLPIKAAVLHTYSNAIRLAGEIAIPETSGEAKFSIQYAIACMLVRGHFGLSDLDVRDMDPNVAKLCERIELRPDDAYEDASKGVRGARLEILLENGARHNCTVLVPKGEPENPFLIGDCIEKLVNCVWSDCSNRSQKEEIAGAFIEAVFSFVASPAAPFCFSDLIVEGGAL